MFAQSLACTILGSNAVPVTVEASVRRGLPNLIILGMRAAEAIETRERIKCGLAALDLDLKLQRIVVNIAPADLPKGGAALDLPITLAILAAIGVVPSARVSTIVSHGEVSLDGSVRATDGAVASAFTATKLGASEFIVAKDSAQKAALSNAKVIPVRTLSEVVNYLTDKTDISALTAPEIEHSSAGFSVDLSDVKSQPAGVEALMVAAAGGHNTLFFGEPGCGKTMLAQRLETILPNLEYEQALEVSTIHDAAGLRERDVTLKPPFRAPHHTITTQALIGGGATRQLAGELTLAHHGVLFLDELPEFRPSAIDALRQPLEEHEVRVRRAGWVARYPCKTQLIAAMNLCRCGRLGSSDNSGGCKCSEASRQAYQRRVSGAIIDRFDLRVRLHKPRALFAAKSTIDSSEALERVKAARKLQQERWNGQHLNGELVKIQDERIQITVSAQQKLTSLANNSLNGRTQRSVVRVARTLADLDESPEIFDKHITSAYMLCRADPLRGS